MRRILLVIAIGLVIGDYGPLLPDITLVKPFTRD